MTRAVSLKKEQNAIPVGLLLSRETEEKEFQKKGNFYQFFWRG